MDRQDPPDKQPREAIPKTTYLPPEHYEALQALKKLCPHVKESKIIAEAIKALHEMSELGFDAGQIRPSFWTDDQMRKTLFSTRKGSSLIKKVQGLR